MIVINGKTDNINWDDITAHGIKNVVQDCEGYRVFSPLVNADIPLPLHLWLTASRIIPALRGEKAGNKIIATAEAHHNAQKTGGHATLIYEALCYLDEYENSALLMEFGRILNEVNRQAREDLQH